MTETMNIALCLAADIDPADPEIVALVLDRCQRSAARLEGEPVYVGTTDDPGWPAPGLAYHHWTVQAVRPTA